MTAHRDDRGRFVSADVAAADRVLQAACDEAVRLLRTSLRFPWASSRLVVWSSTTPAAECPFPPCVEDVENTLYAAGYSASLLLDRRAS